MRGLGCSLCSVNGKKLYGDRQSDDVVVAEWLDV